MPSEGAFEEPKAILPPLCVKHLQIYLSSLGLYMVMPFKSKRTYRRRYRKKPRKAPIYKQLRSIRKQLKGEWKFNDTDETATPTAISGTGTYFNLGQIGEGDDKTQRDGSRIIIRSMYVRGSFTSVDGKMVRMLLVHWPQSNNSTLSVTDIFHQNAAGRMFYSPVHEDKTKKYRILMDKVFQVKPGADLDSAERPFKIYKSFKHHVVTYSGSTASETSITQGSLNLIFIGGDAISNASLKMFMRVRFTEN